MVSYMSDPIIWSLIGIGLLCVEIFFIQGMGVLFMGFAAITVGITMYIHPDLEYANLAVKIVYFLLFTTMWGALLWYPLKSFCGYSCENDYKNIVGTLGIVSDVVTKETLGNMRWSGTTVKCKVDPESNYNSIKPETHVRVTGLVDNIFIVSPLK